MSSAKQTRKFKDMKNFIYANCFLPLALAACGGSTGNSMVDSPPPVPRQAALGMLELEKQLNEDSVTFLAASAPSPEQITSLGSATYRGAIGLYFRPFTGLRSPTELGQIDIRLTLDDNPTISAEAYNFKRRVTTVDNLELSSGEIEISGDLSSINLPLRGSEKYPHVERGYDLNLELDFAGSNAEHLGGEVTGTYTVSQPNLPDNVRNAQGVVYTDRQ